MKTQDEIELLDVLHDAPVPHTFEDLVTLSGLSASQLLLAVDHLSRTGDVVLRKVGMDYHVSRSVAA
ncbi:MAG: hypothetical protein NW701_16550 [Nitrospira sp.]